MKKIRKMILFFMIIFCGIILINVSLSGLECPQCFEEWKAEIVCEDWCDFYHGVGCAGVAPPNCDCIGTSGVCFCQFWFFCENEASARRDLESSCSECN